MLVACRDPRLDRRRVGPAQRGRADPAQPPGRPDRVAGWYLLAPQATSLAESIIGHDQRPKIVAVPAHDQFSPPDAVDAAVATWTATSVTVVDGADHFLASAMGAVVDAAYNWVTTTALR